MTGRPPERRDRQVRKLRGEKRGRVRRGRLFIGARGALGVIVEVILKTYPLKALPNPSCGALAGASGPRWVQRVPLGMRSHPIGGCG